ncbi:Mini-ribonuclease III [Candidatus Syntrophocurvum alkaliphilum]|uniref:Mini-ribonuclease 3 n=1 Tax=Candidatus Syntrophocurvum alkaliphilum TaxID=2293317 RepID=A0A6I6DFD1_9FIRM|nr:ribonuclease III domain-containing protein [Candidatus Syntrophocurvum alkaliphilum]QGU00756.1 Mini-ribonuclease III [Candidatus Syntrophocurvum alkaliphilum]
MLIYDKVDELTLREYSPVILAYIGDAVFELFVRTYLVAEGNRKIKNIHKNTTEYVKAESQAKAVRYLYDELNEDEKEIVLRGRNAKSTPPKHADYMDYRMSTGFEALLGYLYLKGDKQRLAYLVNQVLESD